MSASALRRALLAEDGTFLVIAMDEDTNTLAGHAFARRFPVSALEGAELPKSGNRVPLEGFALWITQLVVNKNYRRRGVAAHLISTALDGKDICAGLVTSHPYAVRALENACRKACNVDFTFRWGQTILGICGVEYLRELVVTNENCAVNTNFYVDHTEVNQIIERMGAEGRWFLGSLEDGEEFVAVVDLRSKLYS